jgi:superfamily II DNA or RNA helicase
LLFYKELFGIEYVLRTDDIDFALRSDAITAYQEGRKVLVLTERTEHLSLLRDALGGAVETCFVLHGRLSKKQRAAVLSGLDELDESAPRVLLATGRLVGEGFDHPRWILWCWPFPSPGRARSSNMPVAFTGAMPARKM